VTEKLSFAVENIEFLEEENNSQFATLKIDAFASGENRHNLYISDETLKKTAPTIIQKPIMWAYNRRTDDASSHDDTEIICGFIPHDTPIDFRKLEDGRTMMSVIGKLWTRYSDKLMDIFHRDKNKSVSVEMEVYEESDNKDFGMQEILNFCYTGITVLGEMVSPAIPLANAELMAFACKEKEDYEQALLEFSNKYESVDMSIPKDVKSNANKGLELYKQLNTGGTSISLAIARHLVKNDTVSIDKIKTIHKFLNSRKNIPKNRNNPDGEYIAWMLHGGSHAIEWSNNMVDAIKQIDEKRLSYFDDGEILTFPYKSIGEAPENMKKLDGASLSLNQINQIAKVADAIGVDEGKNGYAIAKSQFKKSHHIENGVWVKNKTKKEESFVEDLEKKEEQMAEEKLPESETKPEEEKMSEETTEEKPKEEEMAIEKPSEEDKEGKEEGKEEEEEKKGEPKEEKMSLDSNIDMAALMQMLVEETEDNKELADKYTAGEEMDYALLCSAMYKKMCKMQAESEAAKNDKDVYMGENANLKEYKDKIEKQQFDYAVEKTLQEVSDVFSKEEIDNAREEVKDFNAENLSAWQSNMKSKAFSRIKDNPKKKESFTRIATVHSWLNKNNEPEDATKEYAKKGWL
jgi:hypothetical protein